MVRLRSTAVVASIAWAAAAGAATAHHSFAMFDAEHPIDIRGTVKEFRFVSPHTILIVDVKGEDGSIKSWILEGGAPGLQAREGLTSKSLKPGDDTQSKRSSMRHIRLAFIMPRISNLSRQIDMATRRGKCFFCAAIGAVARSAWMGR